MRSHRFAILLLVPLVLPAPASAQMLPGTKRLEGKEDFARVMVDGIHRYLDKATAESVKTRTASWKPDYSSPQAYAKSVEPQRQHLRKILGVVDQRLPPAMEYVGTTEHSTLIAETKEYRVFAVRWPVLPGVHGEGLLLEPTGKVRASVVAIPDADQTPEMVAGLEEGVFTAPVGATLASVGVRVIIPTLVNRKDTWSGSARVGRFTNQTHREFVYRMAFEMGRHVIGYEIQKVLSAVDWFRKQDGEKMPILLWGYGEGGMLALYSAAMDERIDKVEVVGYYGSRQELWQEPIYRNVWGLLREFGDAELAQLIAPRTLYVVDRAFDPAPAPSARPGRSGAAPGVLKTVDIAAWKAECKRAVGLLSNRAPLGLRGSNTSRAKGKVARPGNMMNFLWNGIGLPFGVKPKVALPEKTLLLNPEARQKRQFDELVDYTQSLMGDLRGPAAQRREQFFWKKLDTSSLDKFQKSQEPLRDSFWNDIIGKLPAPTKPMNPRTRLIFNEPKWKGYEVVLDLYDDVICYGILLVPNDLKPGEKRPCVVCQHGLEGRPNDVVNPKVKSVYHAFGAQLADRGFIVFAPQNPYIFQNHFRQFGRKANPLGLHIYSFIVRQHERILEWLGTLPFVDARRIAYYGLSYGGKVAMRIPSILLGYCLSICSGDFNEWIWKNINLDWTGSYMFTGEYDMYEFNLGNTFNYAEMAALIAPRPFMVERGHSDGVGLDEYVAFEYAKVRRLYAKLGIADRTEIEFFSGGHQIHGVGTFAFLHRHLNWPAPK